MLAEGEFIDTSVPGLQPISFVIPAHNEAKYIEKTIKAIWSAVEELKLIAEVIVVNDASTDDTVSIAIANGAKIVDVELRNIGAVRNAGAKEAVHPWLVFVDADTVLPAKTLGDSIQSLASGAVGGGARVVIDETQPLFFVKRLMYLAVVVVWQVMGRWAAGCYMFCRKDVFDSFGGFDEKFFAAEELFFSRQIKSRGKFKLVTNPVVTSARKLHGYSTWELARFIFLPILSLRSLFQSRTGLELLYEDRR
jgi:glycosyltransferase involved in cell wall biosynthesis